MSAVTFSTPELLTGETLFSSSSAYSVLEFIGEGCFGKVAKCVNIVTKETVAVKILKEDAGVILDSEKEVSMLEVISVLNPDQTNLVKFFERFEYMGQTCLAFEMLDTNLYDLLQEFGWRPLSLSAIRPIAEQLLVALDALKGLGILHMDIKPDNVMVVSKQKQQIRVKLIDFGAAITADEVKVGLNVQPGGYRAPEVSLGLPFTEAIDVWGVGCVLAALYLAENPFPVNCDYQMMKSIVEVVGQPEEQLLRAGIHTRFFFTEEKEEAADAPSWRLLTPEEFTAVNYIEVKEQDSVVELPSSLDALVHMYPEEGAAELQDRFEFVDLMKRLLHLNGDQRICPRQALQHPFISMSHLSQHPDSTHLEMMGTKQNRSEQDSDSGSFALSTGPTDEALPSCFMDGDKDLVSYEGDPPTGSCDGVPAIYSYGASLAFWRSYGAPQLLFLEEAPDVGLSDGEEPQISCEDPEASDGGLSSLSSTSSSDGGHSLSSTSSSDEGLSSLSSTLSSDEGHSLSSTSSSDGGLSSLSSTSSSDGGHSLSSTSSSDEGLSSLSSTSSSDGGQCSPSSTSSSGSSDADSVSLSSDCAHVRASCEEAPLPGSLEGDDPTDSSAAASASSGRSKKVLKRIGRFFRGVAAYFCCCCRAEE